MHKISSKVICLTIVASLLAFPNAVFGQETDGGHNWSANSDISSMMENADDNMSSVTDQFNALMQQFQENTESNNKELEIPTLGEGYSADVTSLFDQTFGDLKNSMKLEQATIPDSFNVQDMMSQATKARNSAFSGFKQSKAYKNTLGQISIGSAFKKARQTRTMPTLDSASDMSAALGGISSIAQNQANSDQGEFESKLYGIEAANKADADPDNPKSQAALNDKNAKNAFDQNVKDTAKWLNNNKPEIEEHQEEEISVDRTAGARRRQRIEEMEEEAGLQPFYSPDQSASPAGN